MAGHRMGSDSTRLNHRYLRYCPAQASTSRGSASLQPSSWDPAGARGSLYRLTQICGNQMVSAHHSAGTSALWAWMVVFSKSVVLTLRR